MTMNSSKITNKKLSEVKHNKKEDESYKLIIQSCASKAIEDDDIERDSSVEDPWRWPQW
jgi:hypothetical protein